MNPGAPLFVYESEEAPVGPKITGLVACIPRLVCPMSSAPQPGPWQQSDGRRHIAPPPGCFLYSTVRLYRRK